jgi:hypothetical protein
MMTLPALTGRTSETDSRITRSSSELISKRRLSFFNAGVIITAWVLHRVARFCG